MTGCTSWATRSRRPAAWWPLLLLAAAAAGMQPAAGATVADLRDMFERAGRILRRAHDATGGRDAGRVSLLLARADAELEQFQEAGGMVHLDETLRAAREEAARGNLAGAAAAVERGRAILPALSDYVMTRQAEVAGREALQAARDGDAARVLRALDGLETAVLAPALRARLDDARRGIARARAAMVRRDMKTGAAEITAALRAMDRLRYAGALSRASFGLAIGAELLRESALIAAQDQTRRALREIQTAAELADPPEQAALREVRDETADLWRRMTRERDGDAARLAGVATRLEELRTRLAAR